MANTAEKNIEYLRNDIDNLELSLVCADENGLFHLLQQTHEKTPADHKSTDDQAGIEKGKTTPTYKDIVDNLVAASKELDKEKTQDPAPPPETCFTEGWPKYRAATYQFNQALNSAPISWRFTYLYGGPFAVYYVLMLAAVLLVWFFSASTISDAKILWIPVYAFLWGLVGGILQGFWFLWQHVSDRQLRKVWIPWYIFLPLMGSLLGALAYLVFLAGFITSTGATQVQSEYFIMLLCALAGFSSKWAVETSTK